MDRPAVRTRAAAPPVAAPPAPRAPRGLHPERLVQEALAARRVPFGAFHRRRLEEFARELARRVAGAPGPVPLDEQQLVREAAGDLLEQLAQLSGRALVAEFHAFRRGRGLPPDPSRRTAYDLFVEHVATPTAERAVLRRLPVLDRLLAGAVRQRLALLGEVLDAVRSDWPRLREAGIAPRGPLQRITTSSGDAHNDGRRVVVLVLAGGRVVHKPRSLAADAALAAAAALLTPHLEPGCDLRLPRTVLAGGHGWQEHVAAAPAGSVDEVRRHRYRTGAFLALFAALGSTDLHHENVVASGEHPMFVDLETVLQHCARADDEDRPVGLASPLLSTMLLPMRVAGSALDVDLSGIGTARTQNCTLLSFSVLDPATDAVRFERAPFPVAHGANLVHLGDVPVPPTVFADDLVHGFRDALEGLRALGPAVLDAVRDARPALRQVVRPTSVYARFLAASTHPRYLADPAERSRLLARLVPPRGVAPAAAAAVSELERAALERHDVPWFEVDLEGGDLRAPLDGTVRGAYEEPLLARAREAGARLLATPVEAHEHLVRMCLATTAEDPPLAPLDARPAPGAYLTGLVGDAAVPLWRGVADLLAATALPAGDLRTWLSPSVDGPPGASSLVFRPGDLSLYEGAGAPLLLGAVAAHVGDADAAALARAALPPGATGPDLASPQGLSLWSGIAGSAYLLHELGTLLHDPELLQRRDAVLRDLLAARPGDRHEVDVVGGAAASAAWLAALAPQVPHLPLEGFLRAAADQALAALVAGALPRDGLAHGDLGVAWCLARTAAALGDHRALDAAAAVLERVAAEVRTAVLPVRPLRAHAAWCKGTAGSLTALSEGLLLVGWSTDDVGPLAEQLVVRLERQLAGPGRDVSPCHGGTGAVQALLHAARALDRPDLRTAATGAFARLRARARTDGATGGLRGSEGFLGTMLGLTGAAHTELLLHHPAWGSPLALAPSSGGSSGGAG